MIIASRPGGACQVQTGVSSGSEQPGMQRGAEDARRDVARQLVRNREAFGTPWQEMPVFGTSAARFNDDGVTALYQELRDLLAALGLPVGSGEQIGRASCRERV